jgi:hypothetical protein
MKMIAGGVYCLVNQIIESNWLLGAIIAVAVARTSVSVAYGVRYTRRRKYNNFGAYR